MNWQELMKVDEARDQVGNAHASQGYKNFKEAPEIVVVVLDSGCDVEHKSLAQVIKKAVSFAENVKSSKLMLPDEKDDHGTLSTGLVAGVEDEEGKFLGGVARPGSGIDVKLIAARYNDSLKVEKDIKTLESLGESARVISNSYGWGRGVMKLGPAQQLGACIKKLAENGVVCLYAAGNDGKKIPADTDLVAMRSAILVGATVWKSDAEVFSKDSNFAAGLTVCAPGGDASGLRPVSTSTKGKYAAHGNTSAACPMVAGVVALMLSANPGLDPPTIKEILCLTADQIDKDCIDGDGKWSTAQLVLGNPEKEVLADSLFGQPYSKRYGFGRVNAEEAVKEAIARKK